MPRPRAEGVITRAMWASILFVGAIMATGTLLVFDASLPGGLIEGGQYALRPDDGIYYSGVFQFVQRLQRAL